MVAPVGTTEKIMLEKTRLTARRRVIQCRGIRTNACAGAFLWLGLVLGAAPVSRAAEDITDLPLEQLLHLPVVAASRYEQRLDEVAAAASVITREEIQTFGWRVIDEALASLPGFHNTYDRQYHYLGTRGFGVPGDFNTRLLVSINGNRANDVLYDSGPSGRVLPLDLGLIERIEFIPGSAGSVYRQNALFGVINVVTRPGAELNGAELAFSHDSLGAARQVRVSWGKLLANGFDVLVSGSAYDADGEDHFYDFGAAGVAGIARDLDGDRDREAFLRIEREPWSFDFSFGDRRKDDPTAQYFADPLTPGQYQQDRYLLTQLHYQDDFHGGTQQLSARLYLGRERYAGMFRYSGEPNLAKGISAWQGFELRWLSRDFAKHRLMLGLEAQDDSRRDQSNDDLVNPGNSIFIPGSGWRGGIYLQDEWLPIDTLNVTLGVRFDRNAHDRDAISPRAAVIWKPVPATTVKALYGRAYREPNAYERDFDDGLSQVANPDLPGETIDTLELVLEQRVRPRLWVRGSVYHWIMRDLVVLGIDATSLLSQYQSGDDVTATGVELSLDKTWDWGGRVRGSLSRQHVSFDQGGRLENSPRLLGKLNASGPVPGTSLRIGYELQYVSKRLSGDGTWLSDYWLSNLNLATTTPVKGLDLSLALHNLFNERYAHTGSDINWQNAIEQDGRSVRLQVAWRF